MADLEYPAVGKSRSIPLRIADAMINRMLRLPQAAGEYTVITDLKVPMRDGVQLLADVYTPVGPVSGTLLVRSPYGWPLPMAALTGSVYASRGYRVILARCRGTFGSGGEFEPMVNEIDDAADTVAWMREQPWFEGRFATYGGSYLGFTQWALLMDPPPELATVLISVGPHDFYDAVYQGGAFNLVDFLGWSDQMAHQEDGFKGRIWNVLTGRRRVSAAAAGLPLLDAGEQLLQGRSAWYRHWVSRRDPRDPMWSNMKLQAALDRVQVPVLLQSGWQDIFLAQTLEQYRHLRTRGLDVAITMGPWTHGELVTKGGSVMVGESLDWLDQHLAGSGIRRRAKPANIFVTGAAARWRDFADWPPPTGEHRLYLLPGGGLGDQPPPQESSISFIYNPVDPTPTVGGRVVLGGGYTDDSALALRSDVAVFTGPPLGAPLEVHGNPVVELGHATDNSHADLFVRLSEVDPQGRSRNVSDGFLRLDPATANGSVRLELDAVAHRFAAGNRVRLLVAGGSFPRWERNLGIDGDLASSGRMQSSRRTLDLAASRVMLPIES